MWTEDWDPDADDRWDEEQWEAFFRENDKRVDRYMALLHDFLARHPRPPADDARALARWKDHLRRFVERKGWTRDDIALPFLWLSDEEDDEAAAFFAFGDALDDEEDDGFDDDLLFDDDPFFEDDLDPLDDFRHLPIYQHAFEVTTEVLDWADTVPGDIKDGAFVQFCALVTRIPANIAKGHGLGYEREMLGGNIACAKRALHAANDALDALRQLKREPYLDLPTYQRLAETVYELRNALGLYVQDLRHRFDLGID
jgi:hypothetical protein